MCIIIGPEIHCLEGYDKNSNVWKNKITIPMLTEIGSDYESLEGKDKNSNVYKNRARIPVFGTIRK